MYTSVKYDSYCIAKMERKESIKMKQLFEEKDQTFKEVLINPNICNV